MLEPITRLAEDGSFRRLTGRYRHAWWTLSVPLYLLFFAFAERTVTSHYWISYSPLDDRIPFVAAFVWPYVLWYPFLAVTGVWLILRDADAFRRYIWSIMIGFNGSILFCLLFPNGQDLRPSPVPGTGLDVELIRRLYAVDTNTNVLPSVHVIGSMLVVLAAFDSPTVSRPWRLAAIVLAVLINVSTVCIKQHSVLDIGAGLIASALVYVIVYVGLRRLLQRSRPASGTGAAA